jgi:hypothetical protein
MSKLPSLKKLLREHYFSHKIGNKLYAEVRFYQCSQCGSRYAARFQFVDNSGLGMPYGRSEAYGSQYLLGGRSPKGKNLLCDFCMSISGVVDAVKELEKQKARAKSSLKSIRNEAKDIIARLKDIIGDE